MNRRMFLKLKIGVIAYLLTPKVIKQKTKAATAVQTGLVFDGVGASFDGGWLFAETAVNEHETKVFMPIIRRN